MHRFSDAAGAEAALPFFANSRANGTTLEVASGPSIGNSTTALVGPASNGTEYTLYMSSGPLLFRVTGVAPVGNPAGDVEQVMLGLLTESLVNQPGNESVEDPAVPTATAIAVPQPTATPYVIQTLGSELLTPGPSEIVASQSTTCQLVELYPGYPGFRGYVVGVDGPAEVACLQDLIASDPTFDKDAEDAANLAAAQALGLAGTLMEWTWENWMAIEAQRGLPPTCYSCLFRDLERDPERETAAWDPSDPRLQMGEYGTTEAISQAAARVGLGPTSTAFYLDLFDPDDHDALGADHVLRAFVGLAWPGHHTAPEMLDLYDALFTQYAEPGATFVDPGYLWDPILNQGGYSPTPPTAHIDDQMYMVRTSAEAICSQMPEDTCDAWLGFYDGIEARFLNEAATSGPDISFAEWLRNEVPNPLGS